MLGDSFLSQNLVYEREKTNPFAAGPTMEAVIVALFFSAILILLMIAMFLVACRIFLPGAFAYLRGRYSELRRAAAPDIYRVELNTNGGRKALQMIFSCSRSRYYPG